MEIYYHRAGDRYWQGPVREFGSGSWYEQKRQIGFVVESRFDKPYGHILEGVDGAGTPTQLRFEDRAQANAWIRRHKPTLAPETIAA